MDKKGELVLEGIEQWDDFVNSEIKKNLTAALVALSIPINQSRLEMTSDVYFLFIEHPEVNRERGWTMWGELYHRVQIIEGVGTCKIVDIKKLRYYTLYPFGLHE